MRVAKPTPRLRMVATGDKVKLPGNTTEYTVDSILSDGYYLLTNNGRPLVIASPCHEIEEIK